MRSNQVAVLCLVLVVVMTAVGSFAGDAEEAAVKVATSWLALVDAGEYGKSWDESASLLKAAVTRTDFEQSLAAARKPLGDLVSRKVTSTQYATALPGAPDGEYVIVQFATVFSKKKSAVETVTPMKDSDGVWRVSGYYIK